MNNLTNKPITRIIQGYSKRMEHNEWVHERFASLLNFSEDNSVEFIIMSGKKFKYNIYHLTLLFLVKKSKSSVDVYKILLDFGFPDITSTNDFAFKLFEIYSPYYRKEAVIIKKV